MVTGSEPSRRGVQVDDRPMVYVVDDDAAMCAGLETLFRSVGLRARLFSSASALLASDLGDVPGCLVVDVRLPGLGGLDLQAKLLDTGIDLPIVFMTGHGDIRMTVRAMRAGAVDFLEKPFRSQDMLDAVSRALVKHGTRREAEAATRALKAAYEGLTDRQREVMTLVTRGLMNKQIAAQLQLSEITVQQHRSQVMRKMRAKSLAASWPSPIIASMRQSASTRRSAGVPREPTHIVSALDLRRSRHAGGGGRRRTYTEVWGDHRKMHVQQPHVR
jgi:FixJ family two-component response regulator